MLIQSKSKSNTFTNFSVDESCSNTSRNREFEGEKYIYQENNEENEKIKKEKIMDMIEKLGYSKKYVEECIKNNLSCHACAVYYLLMNYEKI